MHFGTAVWDINRYNRWLVDVGTAVGCSYSGWALLQVPRTVIVILRRMIASTYGTVYTTMKLTVAELILSVYMDVVYPSAEQLSWREPPLPLAHTKMLPLPPRPVLIPR